MDGRKSGINDRRGQEQVQSGRGEVRNLNRGGLDGVIGGRFVTVTLRDTVQPARTLRI